MSHELQGDAMRHVKFLIIIIFVRLSPAFAAGVFAQTPATKPPQLQVVAVVGCVGQQGDNWILTSATGPIVVPIGDGKVQSGSGVTVEKAKAQAPGKERYRLINMLDEFGVAGHK